jgi:hypothetical protein
MMSNKPNPPQALIKANCKNCLYARGYENHLTTCAIFNVKRPYGVRKCEIFKKQINK